MFEDVAAVATAIGVFVAVLAVRAANLQRRRQFETIYVQRYWMLIDKLSLDALKGCGPPEDGIDRAAPESCVARIDETDQRVVRSYLRLCEDELELRQKGWISEETWSIWRIGIDAQLRRWPFKQIWGEVNAQTDPAELGHKVLEEFELLRAFSNGQTDPLEAAPRRSRLCGQLVD